MEKFPENKAEYVLPVTAAHLYNSAFVWFNTDNNAAFRLVNASKQIQDGTVAGHCIDNLLGSIFTKPSHFNPMAAVGLLKNAVSAAPEVEQYRINLSLAYMLAGCPEEAEKVVREVLEVNPESLNAYTNLYCAQFQQGNNFGGNFTHRIMQRKFPSWASDMARGTSELLLSDMTDPEYFHCGVKNYEGRYGKMPLKLSNHIHGVTLANFLRTNKSATLNVYLEQGLGDCAMMIPYLKKAQRSVGRLNIVSVSHNSAISMLRTVVSWGSQTAFVLDEDALQVDSNKAGESDFQCWLFDLLEMGLPGEICKPQPPAGNPDGKIGICWRGNAEHPNDQWRSMRFDDIKDFIQKHGSRLYCLQANLTPEEHAFCKSAGMEMSAEGSDYGKLAEIVKNLKSVVTVDTFIGHFAGSLGVPCFTLLAMNVDWRWGMSNNKTPWYSNHTLLRQKKCMNWKDPLNELETLI